MNLALYSATVMSPCVKLRNLVVFISRTVSGKYSSLNTSKNLGHTQCGSVAFFSVLQTRAAPSKVKVAKATFYSSVHGNTSNTLSILKSQDSAAMGSGVP